MKIQEYRTVAEVSLEALDATVNDLIRNGFQPYGDPYTISNVKGRKENFVACQAMVRESEAQDVTQDETPPETTGADFTVG